MNPTHVIQNSNASFNENNIRQPQKVFSPDTHKPVSMVARQPMRHTLNSVPSGSTSLNNLRDSSSSFRTNTDSDSETDLTSNNSHIVVGNRPSAHVNPLPQFNHPQQKSRLKRLLTSKNFWLLFTICAISGTVATVFGVREYQKYNRKPAPDIPLPGRDF